MTKKVLGETPRAMLKRWLVANNQMLYAEKRAKEVFDLTCYQLGRAADGSAISETTLRKIHDGFHLPLPGPAETPSGELSVKVPREELRKLVAAMRDGENLRCYSNEQRLTFVRCADIFEAALLENDDAENKAG